MDYLHKFEKLQEPLPRYTKLCFLGMRNYFKNTSLSSKKDYKLIGALFYLGKPQERCICN